MHFALVTKSLCETQGLGFSQASDTSYASSCAQISDRGTDDEVAHELRLDDAVLLPVKEIPAVHEDPGVHARVTGDHLHENSVRENSRNAWFRNTRKLQVEMV